MEGAIVRKPSRVCVARKPTLTRRPLFFPEYFSKSVRTLGWKRTRKHLLYNKNKTITVAGVYVILGPFDNYDRTPAVAQLARAKQREQITAVRAYVSYTYT